MGNICIKSKYKEIYKSQHYEKDREYYYEKDREYYYDKNGIKELEHQRLRAQPISTNDFFDIVDGEVKVLPVL